LHAQLTNDLQLGLIGFMAWCSVRSDGGARDCAVIRSPLSTARKQGWDMLETLTTQPDRLIDDLRVI